MLVAPMRVSPLPRAQGLASATSGRQNVRIFQPSKRRLRLTGKRWALPKVRLDAMAIAVAGPVNAETVDVTNNHWLFNKHDLLRAVLRQLLVINDFTAQALAQTDPRDNGNVEILPGESDENAPLLVIGPGTGLGVSALIPSANGPIQSREGWSCQFSPRNDDERALDAFMRRHSAHVSAEHFVSGGGLENIHHFLADRAGQPAA